MQTYLREVVLREASFANNALVLDGIAKWNQGSAAALEDVLAARDAAREDPHA